MVQHSILEMGNLLMVQERERLLSRVLRRYGIRALDGVKAFEAGCSTGYHLRLMVQWGGRPEHQAGIDISKAAVDYCRAHAPEIRVHEGSAAAIPEPEASFDLALAFTLLSSVPDEETSAAICRELFRITRPGGLILVHDMRRRNPRNSAVHAVEADDIHRWFPSCPMRVFTCTLAPPVARQVGRYVPWLYGPLSLVPILRTHALYVLRRPALPPVR
jgi:SAM-dependent methyltransferase